eukprot:120491_1
MIQKLLLLHQLIVVFIINAVNTSNRSTAITQHVDWYLDAALHYQLFLSSRETLVINIFYHNSAFDSFVVIILKPMHYELSIDQYGLHNNCISDINYFESDSYKYKTDNTKTANRFYLYNKIIVQLHLFINNKQFYIELHTRKLRSSKDKKKSKYLMHINTLIVSCDFKQLILYIQMIFDPMAGNKNVFVHENVAALSMHKLILYNNKNESTKFISKLAGSFVEAKRSELNVLESLRHRHKKDSLALYSVKYHTHTYSIKINLLINVIVSYLYCDYWCCYWILDHVLEVLYHFEMKHLDLQYLLVE